jgi:putative membrane protein
MRNIHRYGSALVLGASLVLGACGGGGENASTVGATSTGEAAGNVAAGGESAAAAVGNAASGAASAAAGAMNMNTADLAGMGAADQMAILGASNGVEILTSEAAMDKLTNAQAKQYARDMISEHRAMQGKADQMAKKANVTTGSPELATQKTRMANEMSVALKNGTKGAALDRQYIDGQVQAHQQTLTELQAMQNASDANVKQLVTAAIPKVQAHLERAQKIQQSLGGATGGTTGGATGGAMDSMNHGAGGAAHGGTTPAPASGRSGS